MGWIIRTNQYVEPAGRFYVPAYFLATFLATQSKK